MLVCTHVALKLFVCTGRLGRCAIHWTPASFTRCVVFDDGSKVVALIGMFMSAHAIIVADFWIGSIITCSFSSRIERLSRPNQF